MINHSIISPKIDAICVGALSLFAIAIWLIAGFPMPHSTPKLGPLIAVATVINGAHFLASYRLLYQHNSRWKNYPIAAVWLPLGLIGYSVWALSVANVSPLAVQTIFVVTAFYLADHYTGQTFGMISSFAHLTKVTIPNSSRFQLKLALKLLLIWQILWALQLIDNLPYSIRSYFPVFQALQQLLFFTAYFIGSYAFFKITRKNGRALAMRMLVPFYALLCWYLLLQINPAALLVVQLSHAVQYLIFPLRLEMNSCQQESKHFMLQYGAVLGVLATLVFLVTPTLINRTGEGFGIYSQVFLALINIHHFYIDGCIWKLRDPMVRAALFKHLNVRM